MLAISSVELASIQSDLNAILDKTCTIRRATTSGDTWGSQTASYTTVGTCKCLVGQPTGGLLSNYEYIIGNLNTWMVRAPVGTDIREEDHLSIDGQTLTAQVVLTPKSYIGLITVLAAEIKSS